jgi:hypothetical protein
VNPAVGVAILTAALFGGCAAVGGVPLSDGGDGGGPAGDLGEMGPDLAGGGADGGGACTLGSAEHCGTCTTVCPPGGDDGGTLRTCSAATAFGMCGIVCRDEYYDLDGQLANGCEALDEPIQDTTITAVAITLGNVPNTIGNNPQNLTGQVHSDQRTHEKAPTTRPLGREDWWKVTAVGAGDSASGMTACLGITNYPADARYEVCISDSNQATFATQGCQTASGGGASVCVTPPAATDAGLYYVRVRKLAGTNTPNLFALYLKH